MKIAALSERCRNLITHPWVVFASKLFFAVIALYFVFKLVNVHSIVRLFAAADIRFLLIGLALVPVNLGIRIIRWNILLYSIKEQPSWLETIRSVMLGITIGSFTPAEIGDFAGRTLHLTETKKSMVIGLTFLDRIQTLLVFCITGAPFLALVLFPGNRAAAIFSFLLLLLSLFAFAVLGNSRFLFSRFISRFPLLERIVAGMFSINRRQQILSLLFAFLFWGVIVLQMYAFFNAFVPVSFLTALIGTSLVLFLKSFVPFSIGDLGVRELTSVYVFSHFAVSNDASVNASLLIFFANVFVPALCGIPFIRSMDFSAFFNASRQLFNKQP
ncbi:MAG: lysylphosphatidylglycerol synthase transmembrane domain-containing protein [Bacteroidota bacterium]